MRERGDLPAGPIPEVAPVPHRLASPNGRAAADTAAPSRPGPDRAPADRARAAGRPGGEGAHGSDARADALPLTGGDPAPERRTGLADGPEAPDGVQARRQEAFETAWRFLAHRERTEAELTARLERNDVERELIAEVLDDLRAGGYVDDAGFARRFAEDRRNLDGWGAERIEQRLRELGVDRHLIQPALAHDDEHDELAAATELLQRRFPIPPETPRDLERALGFLVRKGYGLELAHDALRRHGALTLDD